jgi:hypothetical protein
MNKNENKNRTERLTKQNTRTHRYDSEPAKVTARKTRTFPCKPDQEQQRPLPNKPIAHPFIFSPIKGKMKRPVLNPEQNQTSRGKSEQRTTKTPKYLCFFPAGGVGLNPIRSCFQEVGDGRPAAAGGLSEEEARHPSEAMGLLLSSPSSSRGRETDGRGRQGGKVQRLS